MKKNLVTKVMSLLLVGVMMLGLIACGNEQPKESSEAPAPSKSEAPAPSASQSEAPAVEDTKVTYPMDTDIEISVYLGGQATLNPEYKSYDESYWHSKVAEVTGIPTKWVVAAQDATALNMMLADEKEAPNIYMTGYAGMAGYRQTAEDGIMLELTDYLEEYAPNYWEFIHRPENEQLLKDVTDDEGRFYFIPGIAENDFNLTYMGPMVRQDWLDECGLEAPVTLEDYEKVLVAFKDKYGATFGAAWSDLNSTGLASGTGAVAFNGASLRIRDGKVVMENLSDEWQAYIEVLADWQKKGLLDGDIFTADRNILRQKIAEGKVGMTCTAMSQLTNYIQDAEAAGNGAVWVGIEYPRTAAGAPTSMIQTNNQWQDYVVAMISAYTPEESIPVALAWLDYFWTEEGFYMCNFGIEGETFEFVDGHAQFTKLVTEDPSGMAQAVTKYGAWNGTFVGIQAEDFLRAKNALTPAVPEAVTTWTKNNEAKNHIMPKVCLTADEKQVYTDAWSPISTYVKETVAKYVKGEEKIDWATFEKTIEGMGVQKCIDAYQAAYERYLAK